MDTVVGAVLTGFLGVVTVAAIYQLGKSSNAIVPTTGAVATTTLNNLFK